MARKKTKFLALLMAGAMTCALAPAAAADSLTLGGDGTCTVTCDGVTAGNEYTVTVVSGTLASYDVTAEGAVCSIDAVTADLDVLTATVNCPDGGPFVVLVGGAFEDRPSPVVAGIVLEDGTVDTRTVTAAVTEPTCTDIGYTTYTFSDGETVVRDTVAALGHDWTVAEEKEPTELETGYCNYVCSRCGATETVTYPVAVCPTASFTDVPDYTNWAHAGIDWAYENGVMAGIGDNQFDPNGLVTRAQTVQVLYALYGKPSVTYSNAFSDVPSGKWYTNAVIWAADSGVAAGYSDGTFRPNDTVTRQQFAAFLYRYASYTGRDVSAQTDLSAFTDAGEISSYAVTSLSWANAEGYIKGSSTTTLNPKGTTTRAQMAAILMRYSND